VSTCGRRDPGGAWNQPPCGPTRRGLLVCRELLGSLVAGRTEARAAAHTGPSFINTAHPHPRRYRSPNPGHPNGRAVARNTAPCGNGPVGRRRASCGRPRRLDPPDRRWQRQRAKRQVTSTAWPLWSRLCTNFQGRAPQQLPAQTAFYPWHYSQKSAGNNVQRFQKVPCQPGSMPGPTRSSRGGR
jgi:hypothetical protein